MKIPSSELLKEKELIYKRLNKQILDILNVSKEGAIIKLDSRNDLKVINTLRQQYIKKGWNVIYGYIQTYKTVTKKFLFFKRQVKVEDIEDVYLIVCQDVECISSINHPLSDALKNDVISNLASSLEYKWLI